MHTVARIPCQARQVTYMSPPAPSLPPLWRILGQQLLHPLFITPVYCIKENERPIAIVVK